MQVGILAQAEHRDTALAPALTRDWPRYKGDPRKRRGQSRIGKVSRKGRSLGPRLEKVLHVARLGVWGALWDITARLLAAQRNRYGAMFTWAVSARVRDRMRGGTSLKGGAGSEPKRFLDPYLKADARSQFPRPQSSAFSATLFGFISCFSLTAVSV